MIKTHRLTKLLALMAFTYSFAMPASAQEFPSDRPIHLVVGYVPGGATDAAARIIADQLSQNLGQSVIVENRPGAGGVIADQYVAKAKPDGTTILLTTMGSLAVAPQLMKLTYDPIKDLAPITMAVKFPLVLITPSSLKIKTLKEFIDLAKKQDGQLNFGSPGVGSASHLAGEMFNYQTGVEILHVPYKGGGPVMVDLLSQRIAAYYASPTSAQAQLKAGKIVALATTGPTRSDFLPDVPTIAESGYPEFNAVNWYAVVAPGNTPTPILERWNKELVKVLNTPDVQAKLEEQGLFPEPGTRDELGRYLETESARWGKVIKARHISLQ